MKRRTLLAALAAAPVAAWVPPRLMAREATEVSKGVESLQENWRAYLAADADVASSREPLELSEAEWRERLPELAFRVLRKEATEPAGTSALNDETRDGVYVCRGCRAPLFTSAMKYDSGTGWPSFFTIIPGAFDTKTDWKLILPRTEYHCVRCGGHHGHVFDDGPPPTGQRWCNNGAALAFVPKNA
jgi:peptide-methionine (R)-S-oxide reductase